VSLPGETAKRAGDVALGGLLLLATIPLQLGIAAAVLVCSGRPVLYRQERSGRYGVPFRLAKFRTMRPAGGRQVTIANDPRITGVGRVLRRYKLDELPQLWHVVGGTMSLVGPRPEVPRYVAFYPETFRRLGELRPGLTDFASLVFRDEEEVLAAHADQPDYYERRLLPLKLVLARVYRRYRSMAVDLRLVAATACVVVGAEGMMRRLLGRGLFQRVRRRVTGGA
jgi:lipopolysaccharide/colanic/teichoic acid biosynthesis glycosyltransferase